MAHKENVELKSKIPSIFFYCNLKIGLNRILKEDPFGFFIDVNMSL